MEQELVGVVIGDNEGYVRVQGAQFFSVFRRQSANPFDGIFVFASSLSGRVKNWGAWAIQTPPTIPFPTDMTPFSMNVGGNSARTANSCKEGAKP